MKMKIIQETTEWTAAAANNLYLVSDNMEYIIAYVPEGAKIAKRFKAPIRWDHRGRKFKVLKEIAESDPDTRQVLGSKGQKYTLTRANGAWTCSCPGFVYRGKCRHADAEV